MLEQEAIETLPSLLSELLQEEKDNFSALIEKISTAEGMYQVLDFPIEQLRSLLELKVNENVLSNLWNYLNHLHNV